MTRQNIDYLLCGCNCTKGCKFSHCGRKQIKNQCFVNGCQCIGYTNILVNQTTQHENSDTEEDSESAASDNETNSVSDDYIDTEIVTE